MDYVARFQVRYGHSWTLMDEFERTPKPYVAGSNPAAPATLPRTVKGCCTLYEPPCCSSTLGPPPRRGGFESSRSHYAPPPALGRENIPSEPTTHHRDRPGRPAPSRISGLTTILPSARGVGSSRPSSTRNMS